MGAVCAVVVAWAMLVPATSGAVTGGTIAGTVRADAGGAPLEGVEVCAFPMSSPGFGGCDLSAADGGYAITGVDPGGYRVSFGSSGSTYIDQYYDHASSWFDADSVSVSEGATTSGIDADLKEAGSISGTVTAADGGEPIEGITVCAEESFNSHCVDTGADGTYTIDGLGAGEYGVSFRGFYAENGSGEFEPLNYVRQYYDGKSSAEDADRVAVVAGQDTSGIDAALEEGAEIAGTVSAASDGEPAEGVEVCLYLAATGAYRGCTSTGPDGNYLLFGLPGGNYKVGFAVESFNSPYTPQYYDGKSTLAAAEVVALATGSRTSGIDAEMHEAGKVAGTVTAAKGGAGIEGLQVCALPVQSGNSRCAPTGAGGGYTIEGVRPGRYVVEFHGAPDYLQQYYSGKASYAAAARITVAEEATTAGINASMQAAGKIKGKVTAAATGDPLSGATVCALPTTSNLFYLGGACAQAGSDGTYTLGGLPGGNYDVRFEPGSSGPGEFGRRDYLTQFYKGASSRASATPVAVTLGQATSGIDAAMKAGGSVSGHVTAADTGEGLAAYVCALPTVSGGDEGCTVANASGDYSLRGLRSGSYKIRFGPGPSSLGYLRQFYAGKATRKEASPVSVTAGTATGAVNAVMQRGGTISGTVTDAVTHEPLTGISVCVGFFSACDTTAADGSYELTGLPTGSYRVRFGGPSFGPGSGSPKYAAVYYHDAYDFEAASKVAVTAGGATAGIDQAMREGARVTGTVVDRVSEDPLGQITVCTSDPVAGFSGCDQTDETGSYAITGLPAGSYRVRFSHDSAWPPSVNAGYAALYYDDSPTAAGATLLDLDFGELAGGVDAEMRLGGSVEGTITRASDHSLLSGVQACATPDSGGEEGPEACAFSEEDGSYAIEGLASGDYVISFNPTEASELPHQYYDGALKRSDATPVSVTLGAATEGVDVALGAGGKITGRITAAADGVPLEGVSVCAYETAGGEEEPSVCESSNGHGEYTLANLVPGAYKLKFSALFYEGDEDPFAEEEGEAVPPREEFLTQFYSGKSSLTTATEVGVGAGGTTAGIDVQMVKPGATVIDDPPPAGGANTPPPAPLAVTPAPKPKPLKCRKGFRKKVVKGKARCVKKHRAKHSRPRR